MVRLYSPLIYIFQNSHKKFHKLSFQNSFPWKLPRSLKNSYKSWDFPRSGNMYCATGLRGQNNEFRRYILCFTKSPFKLDNKIELQHRNLSHFLLSILEATISNGCIKSSVRKASSFPEIFSLSIPRWLYRTPLCKQIHLPQFLKNWALSMK